VKNVFDTIQRHDDVTIALKQTAAVESK